MTTTVLLANGALALWMGIYFELNDGIGDAYVGDCNVVDAWAMWLHVLINVLSSALLGASNYTMQCLTSPTRTDCNIAHAKGDWLDVGVASFRNLTRISWKRRVVWTLLAMSSIPVHFLYNSAVFKELDNNKYEHIVAEPDFLHKKEIDFTIFEGLNTTMLTDDYQASSKPPIASQLHDLYLSEPSSFDMLGLSECFGTYTKPILSGHSHVIVITANTGSNPNVTTSGRWPSWADIGLDGSDARQMPLHW